MAIDKKFRQEAKSAAASAAGRDGTRVGGPRGANREITVLLDRIAQVRITSEGRISKPTALLIDRSNAEAIELGNRLARLISAALIDRVARLHVFAFDSTAYALNAADGSPAGPPAGSNKPETLSQADLAAALEHLRRSRAAVEQIVLLLGAGCREAVGLAGAYAAYQQDLGLAPAVMLINAGGAPKWLECELRRAGAPIIPHSFTGDRNSLARLIPLLCRPSKLELLMGLLESGAAGGSH